MASGILRRSKECHSIIIIIGPAKPGKESGRKAGPTIKTRLITPHSNRQPGKQQQPHSPTRPIEDRCSLPEAGEQGRPQCLRAGTRPSDARCGSQGGSALPTSRQIAPTGNTAARKQQSTQKATAYRKAPAPRGAMLPNNQVNKRGGRCGNGGNSPRAPDTAPAALWLWLWHFTLCLVFRLLVFFIVATLVF